MKNRILFYIMHGESCKNRVDNILNTWGQNNDIVFYSDYEDLSHKIYKVTDKKSYEELEEKHVNGFYFLKNNFNDYEWYFLCDDDTFVNTKKLNEFILKCDKDTVYGNLLNTWDSMPSLFYPSGGGGVLIHKTIMNKMIDTIVVRNVTFADVSLGLNLSEQKINIINSELMHSEPPHFYGIKNEEINEHITFHHIKSYEEMKQLYELCK